MKGKMEEDYFFFCQTQTRKTQRRFRKLPEDLPESLRFAHLNPKVAAYLASKERSKQETEDPFGDGLGKKSLLPDINQAFQSVRNQFDSALSNDEDSQRYLFEEAKLSASTILQQLARILNSYEDLHQFVPKSLEYQLLTSYSDMTADVTVVPREWQTQEMKEQYITQQRDAVSDEDSLDGEVGRPKSRLTVDKSSEMGSRLNFRKLKMKANNILDVPDDGESVLQKNESRTGRRSESRLSVAHSRIIEPSRVASRRKGSTLTSAKSRLLSPTSQRRQDNFSVIGETPPSEARSTVLANPQSYMQTINFQLSNKTFEDKGWIMLKGNEEQVDPNKILEYCIVTLQEQMKNIAVLKHKEEEQGFNQCVTVRYYGDTRKETLLKYRKSPVKQRPSPVQTGGKPVIPSICDERNEGKKLMQATHLDGTTIIYYPSGRPAIVYSSAGFGRPGYYTIVYEDDLDSRMLACFTPMGRGVCYYHSGVVRFLATGKGGHVTHEHGEIERKWKWPVANVKILEAINLHLNSHLIFRCVGQHQMTIMFNCQKEAARFSVSPCPEAEEPRQDEVEHLLTACTFSSRAAKDLMRIFAPKAKSRKSKSKKHLARSHLIEIQKIAMDMPDQVMYDIEADKELARLQRKARNIVDNWLEHYRFAIGYISPSLEGLPEFPSHKRVRSVKSAILSEQQLNVRRAILGVQEEGKKKRVPSAPIVSDEFRSHNHDYDVELAGIAGGETRKDGTTVTFEETTHIRAAGDGTMSPTAMALLDRLTESASRRSSRSKAASARSLSPSRQGTLHSMTSERTASAAGGGMPVHARTNCPLVIRQIILGYERIQCRCSRHHIPFIMDMELEEFINTEAPEGQLIVISVVSSLFPGITAAEEMLTEIYQNQNRNRTRPCVQSRGDMFRIFKYDINTAAEMSDHTTPMLLTRHNVVPGMFLMYCDGKLLFCDHIFNGYGNARKDFRKQVMKSRNDSIHGFSLPKDFRFSPVRGRSGMRSAWGGEIGGAGVDKYGSTGTAVDTSLSPIYRPISSSSSGNSKEIQMESVKRFRVRFMRLRLHTAHVRRQGSHVSQIPRIHAPILKHDVKPKAFSARNRIPQVWS